MDADDALRLDYEQTTQLLRTLVDVRFKLLAFVPTITVAAVGLVGQPRPAAELLGVGMLGLLATIGVAAGLIAFAEVERVHRRSAESSRPARPSP
jgi:hypothetical protein